MAPLHYYIMVKCAVLCNSIWLLEYTEVIATIVCMYLFIHLYNVHLGACKLTYPHPQLLSRVHRVQFFNNDPVLMTLPSSHHRPAELKEFSIFWSPVGARTVSKPLVVSQCHKTEKKQISVITLRKG